MLWEACAAKTRALGGAVELGRTVIGATYEPSRGRWTVRHSGADTGEQMLTARHLINSAPLHELALSVEPRLSERTREAAEGLHYRDFLTVMVILEDRKAFDDNWIYIHDPSVRVGRIQNFKSWSPEMVPDPSRCCYGLEYFCFEGDGLWTMTNAELIALATRELAHIGIAKASDVLDGCVVRQKKAYPVYDAGYADRVATIRAELEQRFPTLHVIGRNGMHKYNNQKPVVDPGLVRAWSEQRVTLSGDAPRLGTLVLRQLCETVLTGSAMQRLHLAPWMLLAVTAAAAVGGCVALARRCAPALTFFGAAVLLSALASMATGWPFGPIRVNASFWWVPALAVALGLGAGISYVGRVVRLPPWAAACLLIALAFPFSTLCHRPPRGDPFGRGLERDLRLIARAPPTSSLLVAYHPMSWYYPECFLRTRYAPSKEFKIVRDRWNDDRLYEHLDAALKDELGDRKAIWCLIPIDDGPELGARACRVSLPGFRKTVEVRGARSLVVGFARDE